MARIISGVHDLPGSVLWGLREEKDEQEQEGLNQEPSLVFQAPVVLRVDLTFFFATTLLATLLTKRAKKHDINGVNLKQ